MLDIKLFRANPEMVKEKLAARNLDTDVVDLLIDLDKKRRNLLVEVEDLKALRNKRSEEIAVLKRKREDATDVIDDMKKVSDEHAISKLNKFLKKLTKKSFVFLT